MLDEKILHPVNKGDLKDHETEPKLPELKKEEAPHDPVKSPIKKPHVEEEILKPKKPILEEIEMIINLCGSKKELKDALVHINNILIDMPKEVKTEAKIKKLK